MESDPSHHFLPAPPIDPAQHLGALLSAGDRIGCLAIAALRPRARLRQASATATFIADLGLSWTPDAVQEFWRTRHDVLMPVGGLFQAHEADLPPGDDCVFHPAALLFLTLTDSDSARRVLALVGPAQRVIEAASLCAFIAASLGLVISPALLLAHWEVSDEV